MKSSFILIILGIHDQKDESTCWAYSFSTMLRASIKSAVKKYMIKDGLKKLAHKDHHKMMRNELRMHIFPFGDNGADPLIIIKLVRDKFFLIFFEIPDQL